MLYIPYDDKRTVDARVRLGIYKQVVEDLKTPVFTVYMIDLTEEQRAELRELDKFPIFADDYPNDTLEDLIRVARTANYTPVQWLEALHLYDKLSLTVIDFRLMYATAIVKLTNSRQPHNFITPIIQLNIDAALRGSKVIEQTQENA
jgi:hypothetical protein